MGEQRALVVGLGEVLWDVFPDGARFGGAPANFACHVAEIAGGRVDVLVASAVGRDDLGRRAIESLSTHGVDTCHVASLPQATGQVLVALDAAGHASYTFADDVAWDHLAWSEGLAGLAAGCDAVALGTLGQRSAESRATIQRFVESTPQRCLRVLDVNLRPPFWSEEVVLRSLELANVLKLNDGELPVLAELLGLRGSPRELMEQLAARFALKVVALTRGEAGAILLGDAGCWSDQPGLPTTVADTVGAGDSYTAALVLGLLDGLPLDAINAWATRVAAFVCSQPGATPHLPAELRNA